MHRRKTGIHLVLAIVIALALSLSACAKSNEGGASNSPANSPSSSAPASQEASSAAPDASSLDPYEVVITYWGKPQKDDALVEAELSKIFQEKMNATIKLQPIASSDYKKRTELAMNTGEKMDLIFTASWLDFFSNITKGAYLELDDLLEEHGQGIKERLNPLYLEAPRLKGKLYAVPTNKEITQGKAFTFRQDIVDKYDIPIETINNMRDLEPWFEKLSQSEPDMIQLFSSGGGGIPFMMYETNSTFRVVGPTPAKVPMFFVDTAASDVQVKTLVDPEIDEINKSEYELYRHYYEKGYINADAATSQTRVEDVRKQGKIWIQSTVWKPGADVSMAASDASGYEFVSHVVEEPIVTTDLATGSMFAISRTSKDPARAMMVLNELHTDKEIINLIVHGIEGKHYNKIGDNRIEPIKDSGYQPGTNWVIGNQLLNYLLPGEPDDLYTNWEQFNNEAKRFPLLGFVFDDSNVKDTLTRLTAVAQDYSILGAGAVANPSKQLDERKQRLIEAGIEDVRDELQKQIDAWWAENKK